MPNPPCHAIHAPVFLDVLVSHDPPYSSARHAQGARGPCTVVKLATWVGQIRCGVGQRSVCGTSFGGQK